MLIVSCVLNEFCSVFFVTVFDSGCVKNTVFPCVSMCRARVGDSSVVSLVLATRSNDSSYTMSVFVSSTRRTLLFTVSRNCGLFLGGVFLSVNEKFWSWMYISFVALSAVNMCVLFDAILTGCVNVPGACCGVNVMLVFVIVASFGMARCIVWSRSIVVLVVFPRGVLKVFVAVNVVSLYIVLSSAFSCTVVGFVVACAVAIGSVL